MGGQCESVGRNCPGGSHGLRNPAIGERDRGQRQRNLECPARRHSGFHQRPTSRHGLAVNLGTNTAKSVCVHALIANAMNIYAGATGVTISTGMEIPPGQGYCWSVSNTNLVYVIASTTGASVSVTWTN